MVKMQLKPLSDPSPGLETTIHSKTELDAFCSSNITLPHMYQYEYVWCQVNPPVPLLQQS